jgi:hypothetical protein
MSETQIAFYDPRIAVAAIEISSINRQDQQRDIGWF